MVKWTLVAVLAGLLLFPGCSKDDLESNRTRTLGEFDPVPSTLATAWEGAHTWSSKDSSHFRVFRFKRPLPHLSTEVIQHGMVRVWTKYARYNGAMGLEAAPAQLPFYIYSENERPKFIEYWENSYEPGLVTIQYRTTDKTLFSNNGLPNAKVQFRYFVIPGSELSKRNLTREEVDRMDYQQLINAFGVSE